MAPKTWIVYSPGESLEDVENDSHKVQAFTERAAAEEYVGNLDGNYEDERVVIVVDPWSKKESRWKVRRQLVPEYVAERVKE